MADNTNASNAADHGAATAPHPDLTRPPAATSQKPAAASEQPPPAPTVSLPVEQLQHYLGIERQLAAFRAEREQELAAAKQAEILAMAKAGESERALEEQRKIFEQRQHDAEKKFRDLEGQVFGERCDATLSDALSGHVFAGQDEASRAAAARMLRTVLRGEIEAARDASGSIVVRDKASGRPAADVLRERLSDPTLAFFFAPASRGGSGGDGTRPPANPANNQPNPGSLEAIAAAFREKQSQYGSMGLHAIQ